MSTDIRIKKFTQLPDLGTSVRNRLLPTGAVIAYAGGGVPTGFLLCDGTIYRQEAYPTLAAVIGRTFSAGGDPANTFKVPTITGPVTNVRYIIKT